MDRDATQRCGRSAEDVRVKVVSVEKVDIFASDQSGAFPSSSGERSAEEGFDRELVYLAYGEGVCR